MITINLYRFIVLNTLTDISLRRHCTWKWIVLLVTDHVFVCSIDVHRRLLYFFFRRKVVYSVDLMKSNRILKEVGDHVLKLYYRMIVVVVRFFFLCRCRFYISLLLKNYWQQPKAKWVSLPALTMLLLVCTDTQKKCSYLYITVWSTVEPTTTTTISYNY